MEYVESYYQSTLAFEQAWPTLDRFLEVETCVVGGGLAGVATALDLVERGRSVALLERNRIGWGASGRSGGFVSEGFHLGGEMLAVRAGTARARSLFELSKVGHKLVEDRIARYSIDCGPIVRGGLSCALREDKPGTLEKHVRVMADNYDTKLEYWSAERLADALHTTRYSGALFNPRTFSLHPLNFVRGLARAADHLGVKIFEQSPVISVTAHESDYLIFTRETRVRAKNIVFCCGGYISNLVKPLANATIPVASYIIVTKPLGAALSTAIRVPFAISDLQYLPNYYRKLHDGRLLWGGRASGWELDSGRIKTVLGRDLVKFFPDLRGAEIEFAWSGLMSYLSHEMPSIGQLGPRQWYATGFGGLGMAATAMAGRLIGLGIAEQDNSWRQFEAFGLPFAGGPLVARAAAQMSIWYETFREKLGRPASIS